MTTIQALIKEIQDQGIPASSLLRKEKILASKLGQEDFLSWINLELAGYKDDSVYPDYRKLSGQIKALNPILGWRPVLFNKAKIEKKLSSRNIKQSASAIEELLADSSKEYEMPYPDEVGAQILAKSEPRTKVSLFLDRAALVGVLTGIRDRLLDWAIGLEKQGIEGDEVEFTEEMKEKAQGVESKYNIGKIENFCGNLGEKNKQEWQNSAIVPREGFWSKFFWLAIIAFVVVVIGNVVSTLILNKFFSR